MAKAVSMTIKMMVDKSSKDAPFVAYNPELDISSCGPTEKKARENVREAIDLLLEEIEEKGQLNEFLAEMGFEVKAKSWAPPKISFEPFVFPLAI